MMYFALFILLIAFNAGAQVQSDCTPSELKILQSPSILAQFVIKGRMSVQDCTPYTVTAERQVLIVVQVINSAGGYESYLSMFERKGFSETAMPVFKSPMLGFDLFPVQFNQKTRLLFVHPSSENNKVAFYMNVQGGPAVSRLARWELTLDKPALTEANKYWVVEAGVMPKIYAEGGVYRALIESRSVEL